MNDYAYQVVTVSHLNNLLLQKKKIFLYLDVKLNPISNPAKASILPIIIALNIKSEVTWHCTLFTNFSEQNSPKYSIGKSLWFAGQKIIESLALQISADHPMGPDSKTIMGPKEPE